MHSCHKGSKLYVVCFPRVKQWTNFESIIYNKVCKISKYWNSVQMSNQIHRHPNQHSEVCNICTRLTIIVTNKSNDRHSINRTRAKNHKLCKDLKYGRLDSREPSRPSPIPHLRTSAGLRRFAPSGPEPAGSSRRPPPGACTQDPSVWRCICWSQARVNLLAAHFGTERDEPWTLTRWGGGTLVVPPPAQASYFRQCLNVSCTLSK